jgi:hypothetical protein
MSDLNSNLKRSKLKFKPDFKICEWDESEIVHGQKGTKLDNFCLILFIAMAFCL